MAKHKKRSKKRVQKQVEKEPNMLLRQVGAVILVVVAIFLSLGGFGTGGGLPVGLFEIVFNVLGGAAYLTPFALLFWAVHKFKSEEDVIP